MDTINLIELFENLFKEDAFKLISIYKITSSRDLRDDVFDPNTFDNFNCYLYDSSESIRRSDYRIVRREIIEQGGSELSCVMQLRGIKINADDEVINYINIKVVQPTKKKTIAPFSLMHLCASTVIKNFSTYSVDATAQLYIACSRFEKLRKLSFRCGPPQSRRTFNFLSILKNLNYPRIIKQTIQSSYYYENLKIDLIPHCENCNGLKHFQQPTCICMVCSLLDRSYYTKISEVTGHFYNQCE